MEDEDAANGHDDRVQDEEPHTPSRNRPSLGKRKAAEGAQLMQSPKKGKQKRKKAKKS